MSGAALRAFRAVVEGKQDRIVDFELLGHFGTDGFDVTGTCSKGSLRQPLANDFTSCVVFPSLQKKSTRYKLTCAAQLTFMAQNLRVHHTIFRRNRRYEQVCMADASSDNLDEHFVVFDGPQGQVP